MQVQVELTTENPQEEKRTSIISRSKLSNLLQKTLRNKFRGLVMRGSKPNLAVRDLQKNISEDKLLHSYILLSTSVNVNIVIIFLVDRSANRVS